MPFTRHPAARLDARAGAFPPHGFDRETSTRAPCRPFPHEDARVVRGLRRDLPGVPGVGPGSSLELDLLERGP